MPKNINCFTIIITLEGVKKIKSQKIQQNSLNEKIHFKPAKSLRFSPQSTPQLKAKSLRSLKPSFFPFVHPMIASSLYHENYFFLELIFGGKEGWTVDHKGKNNQTVTADRKKLCKIPKTDWHISLLSSLAVCSKGFVEIG